MWVAFHAVIIGIIAFDFWYSQKYKKSRLRLTLLSLTWVAIALLFSIVVYVKLGKSAALNYITGYTLEKALSIDNLLVISSLFTLLHIPEAHQKKILLSGLFGAILLRLLFILGGIALIHKAELFFYLFGAFLCYSAFQILSLKKKKNIEETFLYKIAKTLLPMTSNVSAGRFWIKERGKILFTPLFFCLLLVEGSDLVFAIDSIPAILAITDDLFIAYTSNIFAVVGLRSLHSLISHQLVKIPAIKKGISFILFFIGLKMLIKPWFEISTGFSLIVIVLALACCFLLGKKRK